MQAAVADLGIKSNELDANAPIVDQRSPFNQSWVFMDSGAGGERFVANPGLSMNSLPATHTWPLWG